MSAAATIVYCRARVAAERSPFILTKFIVLSQTKPVKISRLIADGTIEERIVQLQEKKRELIKGVIGEGMAGAADKLTLDQLRFLLKPSRR